MVEPSQEKKKLEIIFSSARNRLRHIMRWKQCKTDYQLAELIKISRSTLHSVLDRDAISKATAQKLAEKLDLDLLWVYQGIGEPPELPDEYLEIDTIGPVASEDEDFVYVKKSRARLSAGGGIVPEEGFEAETYGFRRSWLGSIRTSASKLILLEVTGDSMFPKLEDGDMVLIDRNRTNFAHGRIFAVRVEQYVLVKRLDLLPSGRIRVTSLDDEEHSPDYTEEEITIFGQVIWVGRTLI